MAMTPMEHGNGTSLGTYVALTDNTDYVCPSDGYLRISCSNTSGNKVFGYIDGKSMFTLASPSTVSSTETLVTSVLVFMGMTIKYTGTTGSTGRFYPIE